MASEEFQERFRNRSMPMPKSGDILDQKPALPSTLQQTGNIILNQLNQTGKGFSFTRPIKVEFLEATKNRPIEVQSETYEEVLAKAKPTTKAHALPGLTPVLELADIQSEPVSVTNANNRGRQLALPTSAQSSGIYAASAPRFMSDTASRVAPSIAPSNVSVTQSLDFQVQNKQKREINWKPYTLRDYRKIRAGRFNKFGGLGASVIGSNDWSERKKLYDKKRTYARRINAKNQAANYSQSAPSAKEQSTRQRAIEFAKLIRRPKLRTQTLSQTKPIDPNSLFESNELTRLEAEHDKFKTSLEKFRYNI